ncbi:hypothetical protein P7C70_g1238, partial [Phenoliferia sp. Uapishka_3]
MPATRIRQHRRSAVQRNASIPELFAGTGAFQANMRDHGVGGLVAPMSDRASGAMPATFGGERLGEPLAEDCSMAGPETGDSEVEGRMEPDGVGFEGILDGGHENMGGMDEDLSFMADVHPREEAMVDVVVSLTQATFVNWYQALPEVPSETIVPLDFPDQLAWLSGTTPRPTSRPRRSSDASSEALSDKQEDDSSDEEVKPTVKVRAQVTPVNKPDPEDVANIKSHLGDRYYDPPPGRISPLLLKLLARGEYLSTLYSDPRIRTAVEELHQESPNPPPEAKVKKTEGGPKEDDDDEEFQNEGGIRPGDDVRANRGRDDGAGGGPGPRAQAAAAAAAAAAALAAVAAGQVAAQAAQQAQEAAAAAALAAAGDQAQPVIPPPRAETPPPGVFPAPQPDDIGPGPPPDFIPDLHPLSPVEEWQMELYALWRKRNGTVRLWQDQITVLGNHPVHPIAVQSLFKTRSLLVNVTEHIGQRIPMCPKGHISYGCARYADAQECPRCGAPRFPVVVEEPPLQPGQLPPPRQEKVGTKTWLYSGLIPALQAPFADPGMASALRDRNTQTRRLRIARARAQAAADGKDVEWDELTDITSGSAYWELVDAGLFPDDEEHERHAILAFSWDGASLIRDKFSESWFIFIINWTLPIEIRYLKKHLICAGVIPGSPWDIESFMEPLHIDRIRLENGVWTWDASTAAWFVYKAYFVALLADLPARAKAANTVGHTGACGCMKCRLHGVTRKVGGSTYHPAFITPEGLARANYGYNDDPNPHQLVPPAPPFPTLRTNITHLADVAAVELHPVGSAARKAAMLRTGVVGISAWEGALAFDFASFFVIDIMHLFWANITLLFLKLILGKTKGFENAEWVIPQAGRDQISAELESLGVDLPSLWGNRPRGLNKFTSLKCKELSNITFLYSLDLIRPHVSAEIFAMWTTFVELATISVQPSITRDQVEELRIKCRSFVIAWDTIFYGNQDRWRVQLVRMCVHYCIHLAEMTLQWGPMIGYSQYTAERMIGQLKGCIRSQSRYLENLAEQILARMNDNIYAFKYPKEPIPDVTSASLAISLPDGTWTLRYRRSSHPVILDATERQAFERYLAQAQPDPQNVIALAEGFRGHRWARATKKRRIIRSAWGESALADARLRRSSHCEIRTAAGESLFIAVAVYQHLRYNGIDHLVVFGQTFGVNPGPRAADGANAEYLPLGEGGSVFGCWNVESIHQQVAAHEWDRDGRQIVYIASKQDILDELENLVV